MSQSAVVCAAGSEEQKAGGNHGQGSLHSADPAIVKRPAGVGVGRVADRVTPHLPAPGRSGSSGRWDRKSAASLPAPSVTRPPSAPLTLPGPTWTSGALDTAGRGKDPSTSPPEVPPLVGQGGPSNAGGKQRHLGKASQPRAPTQLERLSSKIQAQRDEERRVKEEVGSENVVMDAIRASFLYTHLLDQKEVLDPNSVRPP